MHHLEVGSFEQLLAAIAQLVADELLHARVAEVALTGRFLGQQLDDAEADQLLGVRIDDRDHAAVLTRFELGNRIARGGVGLLERRLRHQAQVAAVAGGFRVLGVIHGHGGEVLAAVEPVEQRLDLLARVGLVLRLIALLVAQLRVGRGGDHEVREVVLRLDEVEFRFVRVVVAGDIGVGNVDLRRDFLVRYLFDGDGAAQIALEVVERDLALLHALVELFLSVRRLDLVELLLHFLVGGEQTELFGALHEHLVVDELLEDVEAQAGCLFFGGLLRRAGGLVVEVLFDFRALDLLAVDLGHDVGRGLAGRAAEREQQAGSENESERARLQRLIIAVQFSSGPILPKPVRVGHP